MKEIKLELSYPTYEGIEQDVYDAEILAPVYSGLYGEITSVLQSLYHAEIFLKLNNISARETLTAIAINDIRHLQILGDTILALGVTPIYTTTLPKAYNFFNTSQINYAKGSEKMLLDDISSKLTIINMYERIILKLRSSKVQAIIKRIVLDEKLHVTLLKEELEKIIGGENN